ncbi:UNVERIFIED_CONTAM: hypothetical protein GTU68_062078 [Idotea baltica]|nr:hypothetical protein [Idotea baltica]
MKKIPVILVVSMLASASAYASEWGYDHGLHPSQWGQISQTCGNGKNQSPIDVTHVINTNLKALDLHYSGQVTKLSNNGHTLQATVTGNNVLMIDGDPYTLKQFHFHTPSENRIDGKQFPLEAHFVHVDKDGHIAVLAVMFEQGEANTSLAKLIATVPDKGETVALKESFNISDLVPSLKQYYHFNGSLTTPPCTEGVSWFLLKQPSTLSKEQDDLLIKAMGHNSRPVQKNNARIIIGS